jgi:hypothetical protein
MKNEAKLFNRLATSNCENGVGKESVLSGRHSVFDTRLELRNELCLKIANPK